MKNFKEFSLKSRPLIFTVLILVSNLAILVVAQSENSEECETLPPPPNLSVSTTSSRSLSTNSNQDKQQQILNQGMDKLHLDRNDRKAIFMLGNTGSGKTTITQTLNGNLNQLRAVLTQGDDLVIIDDQNRIGLPTTKSKTLVPEYVRNPENNVAFYDCPGFDDNRGAESVIAAMYFVNAITEHVKQAKFLFIVTHSALKMGHDRLDFDLLATHASQFLLKMAKFRNSIGLIVSKVSSYSPQGRYISDNKVMTGVVGFLQKFHSTLRENLEDAEAKDVNLIQIKILFIETLLAQDGNGSYSKIWFVRSPPKCGTFSKMPYYREVRRKITDLYTNKLIYASTASTDFGITLKDKTRLKISSEYVPKLMDECKNKTEQAVDELFAKFQITFEENFNKDDKFEDSLSKLNNVYHNLTSMLTKSISFTKGIKKLFLTMKQKVPKVYVNEFSKTGKVLKFYEKVTMTKIEKPSISPSVRKLQSKVQNLRDETFTVIKNTTVPNTFSKVSEIVTNLVEKAEEIYTRNYYTDLSRVTMSAKVNVLKNDAQKLLFLRNKWESFTEQMGIPLISTEIEEVYSQLSYRIPPEQITELGRLENLLNFLGNVMNTPIQKPTGEWLRIPLKFITKLGYLRDWYEFLVQTDDKFKIYETQREISGLRDSTTVSNFGFAMNILKSIPGSFVSSRIMNIAENHVDDVDKAELLNIVRNACSPTKFQCLSNGRKAVITGIYVKFTDFMTSSSELPCSPNLKELEIFASEKLFFDSDVLAMKSWGDMPLSIRITADMWEVINKRTINLQGVKGEAHVPAKTQGSILSVAGHAADGEAGKPGRPGGNGGNFYGIYGKIVNAGKLTVNVNGGDGGDGQEGANGKDGVKGRDVQRGDFPTPGNAHTIIWENKGPSDDFLIHYEHRHVMAGKLGEEGGNGGNGGSGGDAGYSGTFSVSHSHSGNSLSGILVRSQRGNPGKPGKGGEKGLGGRNGHSFSCKRTYTLFIPYWKKCQVEPRNVLAASGRDGLTGGNSNSKMFATQPTH